MHVPVRTLSGFDRPPQCEARSLNKAAACRDDSDGWRCTAVKRRNQSHHRPSIQLLLDTGVAIQTSPCSDRPICVCETNDSVKYKVNWPLGHRRCGKLSSPFLFEWEGTGARLSGRRPRFDHCPRLVLICFYFDDEELLSGGSFARLN